MIPQIKSGRLPCFRKGAFWYIYWMGDKNMGWPCTCQKSQEGAWFLRASWPHKPRPMQFALFSFPSCWVSSCGPCLWGFCNHSHRLRRTGFCGCFLATALIVSHKPGVEGILLVHSGASLSLPREPALHDGCHCVFKHRTSRKTFCTNWLFCNEGGVTTTHFSLPTPVAKPIAGIWLAH